MTEYRVRWEMDIDAESGVEAAQKARAAQIRPGTTAVVFDVDCGNPSGPERVDLLELLEEGKIEPEERQPLSLSSRELATVLCALRNVQDRPLVLNGPWFDGDLKPLDYSEIDELCERLNCGEPAEPEQPTTKVKVWALAFDGDDCGTVASIHLSERALWDEIVDHVGDADDEVKALLEEEDFEGVSEWVEANIGSLDTYNIDEREIDVPAAAPLAPAIVTIVDGCAEVAENPSNLPVEVLDYDNLKETLNECRPWPYDPKGNQPWKRNLRLSSAELAFIRKHDDADFIAEVEAGLETPTIGGDAPKTPAGVFTAGLRELLKDVNRQLIQEETTELAQAAKVVKYAKCPKCGQVDSIELKTDAWETTAVLGMDADGALVHSTLSDTQTFDDSHYECTECGETIDATEIGQAEASE